MVLCLTLCDPMDYTVHGILQAKILEWVTIPFSRGFSHPGIKPRWILYQLRHQGNPSFSWIVVDGRLCFCGNDTVTESKLALLTTQWASKSEMRCGDSSVQFSRWLFATSWTAAHQASLSITNSQSLLKLMSIESVMPSNHLILCCPLLLPPSIFLSIRILSDESVLCIRWPKYWSFSFNISPSNEHSLEVFNPKGLISFRVDLLDLLAG